MFQRSSTILLSIVFLLGLAILSAAWAYSGHMLPHPPPDTVSTYDKVGFYLEIAIWVATIASGLILAVRAWAWQSAKRP